MENATELRVSLVAFFVPETLRPVRFLREP